MKIVLTCGGTGGHIIPAIAIADLLRDNIRDCDILFIGGEGGMEQSLVTAAGYPIKTLDVKGLSRKNPFSVADALIKTRRAIKAVGEIFDDFAPDIVIGTGGYACYPALSCAIRRGIPSVVHESNAVPGLAVRLLAPRLSRVWLGLDAARAHLPKRCHVLTVGNPLPRGFSAVPVQGTGQGGKKIVLSFGGSLGAPVLNEAILDFMEQTRHLKDVYHVHATGKREWEHFSEQLAARGLAGDARLEILPFISDMPRRMREATVVVCRAGAMSIGEIAIAGRAAVLVPSPNVTGDHQLKNAMALAEAGAAVLVEEHEIKSALAPALLSLLENESFRVALEGAVTRFSHPNANKVIYRDIIDLIGRK